MLNSTLPTREKYCITLFTEKPFLYYSSLFSPYTIDAINTIKRPLEPCQPRGAQLSAPFNEVVRSGGWEKEVI